MNNVEITPDKRLSVKIGIGVGECRILVVGGQFRRCEYLAVGEALRQACESETKATEGGQTICSEEVKKHVNNFFEMEETKGGDDHGHGDESSMKYYLILKSTGERTKTKADTYLMRTQFSSDGLREKFPVLKTFVPAAISLYLEIEKETWSKEIRMLTIMFLNLKVDLSQTKNEEGMDRIQSIVKTVQRSIYRTRGALNKFLMDDKGSVMLICWGLPPLSSSDDHVRSVLSAMTLIGELKKLKCGAFMGITTGTCFTGVCGTIGNRREYSLLGEVVNLSARYMGKAMKYAAQNKLENLALVDVKTRDLIQHKIRCEYLSSDQLKGFSGTFHFYAPVEEFRFYPTFNDPFPFIRTHRNNSIPLTLPPDVKADAQQYLSKSLFMIGRDDQVLHFIKLLNSVYKGNTKEIIVVRGVTGSGKSLFVRRSLHEFINSQRELREKFMNTTNGLNLSENKIIISEHVKDSTDTPPFKPPFVFTSFQLPTIHNAPMNGFFPILREIYNILKFSNWDRQLDGKSKLRKMSSKKGNFICDKIGKILFKKNAVSYVKFIEEIIEEDFSAHYEIDPEKDTIIEVPARNDIFFDFRKFEYSCEKAIIRFFKSLIKKYKKFIDNYYKTKMPLVFVVEDSQHFDDISINFIRALRDSNINKKLSSFCLIITYQDPLYTTLKLSADKISKAGDLLTSPKNSCNIIENDPQEGMTTYMMENLMDKSEIQELIKTYLVDYMLEEYKQTIDRIDPVMIEIIVSKSFKGVPLFILDMVDNLINSKRFVQVLSGELIVTSEMMDMEEMRDWSQFMVPTRIEKIVGNIIDSLQPKDIVILKYASVIGNLFDFQKLHQYNPFNNIATDDLSAILYNLERNGIIEILYDLNPKQLVCKFAVPFLREILYQRMLIEQKNDIHLNVARSLQTTNFKYMPHSQEIKFLELHIKTTERTLTSQLEDDDSDAIKKDNAVLHLTKKKEELNLNNLKIFIVKDICDRLKVIDLKLEMESELANYPNEGENALEKVKKNSNMFQAIKAGYIEKKSDKNITWEYRYVVITNTKVFYYYHEKEFLENKMPLGYFYLKNLFEAEILNDYYIGQKTNLFCIQVSSWYKKENVKPHRRFVFSSRTREELYQWIITLNFLRVKATYDEFSSQFGLINLPLKHETRGKMKKKLKEKFKGPGTTDPKEYEEKNYSGQHKTINLYNCFARKSVLSQKSSSKSEKESSDSRNAISSLIRRVSCFPVTNQIESQDEKIEKFNRVKNQVTFVVAKTFLIFLGFVENVIFNMEEVGISEDKVIVTPNFLKELFREEIEEEIDEISQYTIKSNKSPEKNISNSIMSNSVDVRKDDEKDKEKILYEEEEKILKFERVEMEEERNENNGKNNKREGSKETGKLKNYKNKDKVHTTNIEVVEEKSEEFSGSDEDFLDLENKEAVKYKENNKNEVRSFGGENSQVPINTFGENNHTENNSQLEDEERLNTKKSKSKKLKTQESIKSRDRTSGKEVDKNNGSSSNLFTLEKKTDKNRNKKLNNNTKDEILDIPFSREGNTHNNHINIESNNKIFTSDFQPSEENLEKNQGTFTSPVQNTTEVKHSKASKLSLGNEPSNMMNQGFYADESETYSPVINKLKNFDISVGEGEEDYFNFQLKNTKNLNIMNNEVSLKENEVRNEAATPNSNVDPVPERKQSILPRYTDPKYDFLKKENNTEQILKNIHSSNLFKSILKK